MRALVRGRATGFEAELTEVIAIPVLKADTCVAGAACVLDHRIAPGLAMASPGVLTVATLEVADLCECALVVAGAAALPTTPVDTLVGRGEAVRVAFAPGNAAV